MKLEAHEERHPLAGVFRIARGEKHAAVVVVVTVQADGHLGRGEAVPYARYGESVDSALAAIAALPTPMDRTRLARLLPPGAARNAVDCALWDLEAKRTGKPVWQLAGVPEPKPRPCAYTISLDAPDVMEAAARAANRRPLLKIKLGGNEDLGGLEAVRRGAPDSRLIVDANEAWGADQYLDMLPHLQRLGVALVEQPLPAGDDAILEELPRPIPVCADESCHDRASLPALIGRYDAVNIKLDKTGGLSEALALQAEARERGLMVMVGCMVATSLAMAPAMLLAHDAAFVDLDGPLLLAADRPSGLRYDNGSIHPAESALWG